MHRAFRDWAANVANDNRSIDELYEHFRVATASRPSVISSSGTVIGRLAPSLTKEQPRGRLDR